MQGLLNLPYYGAFLDVDGGVQTGDINAYLEVMCVLPEQFGKLGWEFDDPALEFDISQTEYMTRSRIRHETETILCPRARKRLQIANIDI
jgi:hypothetical protein